MTDVGVDVLAEKRRHPRGRDVFKEASDASRHSLGHYESFANDQLPFLLIGEAKRISRMSLLTTVGSSRGREMRRPFARSAS